MAEYASAQAYFAAGDYRIAATQASRAKEKLPQGSPGYLKAEDILNLPPAETEGLDRPRNSVAESGIKPS